MTSKTKTYNIGASELFGLIQKVLRETKLRVKNVNREQRVIFASTEASGFSWGEEYEIKITALKGNRSKITVSSTPKVFINLFAIGSARSNIADFFEALKKRVGS